MWLSVCDREQRKLPESHLHSGSAAASPTRLSGTWGHHLPPTPAKDARRSRKSSRHLGGRRSRGSSRRPARNRAVAKRHSCAVASRQRHRTGQGGRGRTKKRETTCQQRQCRAQGRPPSARSPGIAAGRNARPKKPHLEPGRRELAVSASAARRRDAGRALMALRVASLNVHPQKRHAGGCWALGARLRVPCWPRRGAAAAAKLRFRCPARSKATPRPPVY